MSKIEYTAVEGKSLPYFALLGGLAFMMLLAIGSVFYMEHEGHHVTGMTNQIVWGLPHVFAIFLIVAASGALNVASIASVFRKKIYEPMARLSALLALAVTTACAAEGEESAEQKIARSMTAAVSAAASTSRSLDRSPPTAAAGAPASTLST